MRIGRALGIEVHVHGFLLLLIFLFCLAGFGSKILLLCSAVLWHEWAHAIVASRLDCSVEKIELMPFGGVAAVNGLSDRGVIREFMIAAAGPVASFLLAGISYLLELKESSEWISFYFNVNITLALFNLLPGLPLDGGRMFRAVLALAIGYSRATALAIAVSRLVCAALLLLVGYEFYYRGTINITFIMAACFLQRAAKEEVMVAALRTMRLLALKKDRLRKQGYLPLSQFMVLGHLPVKTILSVFHPDAYHILTIVDQEWREQGRLTEAEIWLAIQKKGILVSLDEILKL